MKCLNCGHCCIHYDVVIIDSPDKPLSPHNVTYKASGIKCKHLLGDAPGVYSCAVHGHPDYKDTPCFDYTQISASQNDPCRVGVYLLKRVI